MTLSFGVAAETFGLLPTEVVLLGLRDMAIVSRHFRKTSLFLDYNQTRRVR